MAVSSFATLFIASGIKLKKALPSRAPAEKATKEGRILFKRLSFKTKVKAPTKEMALMKKVAKIIQIKTIISNG